MPRGPLKLRELLKKLKSHGIRSFPSERGKGSEIILVKPDAPGSKKGPQIPIKNHGLGTEIFVPVIDSVLRRFGIDKKEFWNQLRKRRKVKKPPKEA